MGQGDCDDVCEGGRCGAIGPVYQVETIAGARRLCFRCARGAGHFETRIVPRGWDVIPEAPKPQQWHEPKVGELVRIVEVSPKDPNPYRAIGDVVRIGRAYRESMCGEGFWFVAEDLEGDGGPGTWARVELAEAPRLEVEARKRRTAPHGEPPRKGPRPLEATLELDKFAEVCRAWAAIGPNARAALVEIAQRMVLGRARYDDDFTDERDWPAETRDEYLDGSIYMAVESVKRAKAARCTKCHGTGEYVAPSSRYGAPTRCECGGRV